AGFERWRRIDNEERPHEAPGLAVPLSRYSPSPRPYPERQPPIEYAPDDAVRRVGGKGEISFRGRLLRVGKAFRGEPVALRPTAVDGVFDVYFCHVGIGRIDLTAPPAPPAPSPPGGHDAAAGSGLGHQG
ncbi:MAG TPA: hypothetical protein VFG43_08145, partial [Geminicoccaceae bacterium]|nr:hypothetical protein [Geminicoccaceae bacterium]